MVLLRLKHADARTLVEVGRALVSSLSVPVIVSERLDVALACGAAGVHLTSRSVPVVAVRTHVPDGFLIGGSISTPDDVAHASHADYVTIGPVFGDRASAIGTEALRSLLLACGRPAIAIGGIDASSVTAVRAAGASGVAVIRAVLGAEDPAVAAAKLVEALQGTGTAA
jgi:thiamine-phosphate pyrophosphorylase